MLAAISYQIHVGCLAFTLLGYLLRFAWFSGGRFRFVFAFWTDHPVAKRCP